MTNKKGKVLERWDEVCKPVEGGRVDPKSNLLYSFPVYGSSTWKSTRNWLEKELEDK